MCAGGLAPDPAAVSSMHPDASASNATIISCPPARATALAELVGHLRESRLLPKWVAKLLTDQPEWFEAAFKRQFAEVRATPGGWCGRPSFVSAQLAACHLHSVLPPRAVSIQLTPGTHLPPLQEIRRAQEHTDGASGSANSVAQFWTPRTPDGHVATAAARGAGGRAATLGTGQPPPQLPKPPLPPPQHAPRLAASRPAGRFATNFSDVQELGRGGYGQVVSAKNGAHAHAC